MVRLEVETLINQDNSAATEHAYKGISAWKRAPYSTSWSARKAKTIQAGVGEEQAAEVLSSGYRIQMLLR